MRRSGIIGKMASSGLTLALLPWRSTNSRGSAPALRMLVTDAGVRAAGIADRVLAHLAYRSGVAVYGRAPPDPDEAALRSTARGGRGPISRLRPASPASGEREAWMNMMSASMENALAFQKGPRCVHSLLFTASAMMHWALVTRAPESCAIKSTVYAAAHHPRAPGLATSPAALLPAMRVSVAASSRFRRVGCSLLFDPVLLSQAGL